MIRWLVLLVVFAMPAGAQEIRLRHGGHDRLYELRVPPARGPMPLVVMLHGAGGTARQVLDQTRWAELGAREGFIVAAPQALRVRPGGPASAVVNPTVWSDGSGRGDRARGPIDDIGFIEAVIDDAARRAAIDPARIYLVGHSSGAGMTFHAAADLGRRLAAAAAVAGHWWTPRVTLAPLSFLHLVGDQDPLAPLTGGMARNPWGPPQSMPALAEATVNWANAIGCPPPRTERGEAISVTAWIGCREGAEVQFRVIHGHGHGWSGGRNRLPANLTGPHLNRPDATQAIWDFFRAHRR